MNQWLKDWLCADVEGSARDDADGYHLDVDLVVLKVF
jgi:hypothetical protein